MKQMHRWENTMIPWCSVCLLAIKMSCALHSNLPEGLAFASAHQSKNKGSLAECIFR